MEEEDKGIDVPDSGK